MKASTPGTNLVTLQYPRTKIGMIRLFRNSLSDLAAINETRTSESANKQSRNRQIAFTEETKAGMDRSAMTK